MHGNQVGGSIPAELGDLELRLKTLQLQNNRLNGLIPTFFKRQPFRTMQIDLAGSPFYPYPYPHPYPYPYPYPYP